MNFAEWVEKKFAEWRVEIGRPRATVQEYADWMGVSQSLMSQYMKREGGKVPKAKRQIDAFLAKYPDDPDLYCLLEIPKPKALTVEERAEIILQQLRSTPETEHDRLFQLIEEFMTLKGWRRIK